ncbi:MAG: hypothetical protein HC882_04955 [Acidobacteria bacterium]|nr:hypothetical protein [Acidobacteriota bacterium]
MTAKYVPAYCDPENEVRGAKFDRNLSTKEIAARIRAEIKADTSKGRLPAGLRVSVRYESFAGGSAIRVHVTQVPDGFRILNAERVAFEREHPSEWTDLPRYTAEASALLAAVSVYAKAYHRDNSDLQSDYFDVNFYGGDASFSWELVSEERKGQ